MSDEASASASKSGDDQQQPAPATPTKQESGKAYWERSKTWEKQLTPAKEKRVSTKKTDPAYDSPSSGMEDEPMPASQSNGGNHPFAVDGEVKARPQELLQFSSQPEQAEVDDELNDHSAEEFAADGKDGTADGDQIQLGEEEEDAPPALPPKKTRRTGPADDSVEDQDTGDSDGESSSVSGEGENGGEKGAGKKSQAPPSRKRARETDESSGNGREKEKRKRPVGTRASAWTDEELRRARRLRNRGCRHDEIAKKLSRQFGTLRSAATVRNKLRAAEKKAKSPAKAKKRGRPTGKKSSAWSNAELEAAYELRLEGWKFEQVAVELDAEFGTNRSKDTVRAKLKSGSLAAANKPKPTGNNRMSDLERMQREYYDFLAQGETGAGTGAEPSPGRAARNNRASFSGRQTGSSRKADDIRSHLTSGGGAAAAAAAASSVPGGRSGRRSRGNASQLNEDVNNGGDKQGRVRSKESSQTNGNGESRRGRDRRPGSQQRSRPSTGDRDGSDDESGEKRGSSQSRTRRTSTDYEQTSQTGYRGGTRTGRGSSQRGPTMASSIALLASSYARSSEAVERARRNGRRMEEYKFKLAEKHRRFRRKQERVQRLRDSQARSNKNVIQLYGKDTAEALARLDTEFIASASESETEIPFPEMEPEPKADF